jgi:2-C-methyl-D-erythritol 2,4-cyclodiphosphate synthase
LGAAALGDIGDHFPDNSERWLDADSAELLAIVADMIHEEGYEVVNLDVSVICERPRLGEKKREVRERIAGLLGVSPDVISIKARTKEGLGPVGEGAAIEAYAVVLIEG